MRAEPDSQPLQRIVLTGFMGSGKTTVGRLLASRLGWDFLDLDDEITRRVGISVPEIFVRDGEAAFRREEAAALADCLQRSQLVLALGGGAPETEANCRLLQSTPGVAIVYLEGAFETLQARCLQQSSRTGAVGRPNFSDPDLAKQRFDRRAPIYAGISTHTLHTDHRSPEALAEEIQAVLGLPGTP